jgi:D-alanyl-D-alanine carboxypeptidase/D-alanyl-D-alanine-endopeptidase (penicillin-binding protein 4)
MITRELGLKVKNEGTTAAGVAAISDELKSLGVDVSQLSFSDGSGLGRSNRASCQSLVEVINTGERSGFSALWSGLPIAGETGTLTNQLKDTPLAGHLKAKTGSLAGVTGLTGLIDVRRPLRFSLLINGEFTEAGGVDLRSQAAQIIGAFPDAPGIDVLSPIPAGT